MLQFSKFLLSMKHNLRTSMQQNAVKYSEETKHLVLLVCWNSVSASCKNTSLRLVAHAGQVLTNPNNYPEKALSGQSFHSLIWQGVKCQAHHCTYLKWSFFFFFFASGRYVGWCLPLLKVQPSPTKRQEPLGTVLITAYKGTKVELRQELYACLSSRPDN